MMGMPATALGCRLQPARPTACTELGYRSYDKSGARMVRSETPGLGRTAAPRPSPSTPVPGRSPGRACCTRSAVTVVPRPADWPDHCAPVTGYWFLDAAEELDASLGSSCATFLDAGDPPVLRRVREHGRP